MLNDFLSIIIDESPDARLTEALMEAGFKTISIQKLMPGIDDIEVIKVAVAEGAYIITEDKDFGDELVYKKGVHHGAMLLRLSGVAVEKKIQLVLAAFSKYPNELKNAFAVLSERKIRIKRNEV